MFFFFKSQYLWKMLTYEFISRLEPAILRTRGHTNLFLLQGTSLQLSKTVVRWKEKRKKNPKSSVVHKHKLQFAFESFATEFSPLHRSQTEWTLNKIPAKTLIKDLLSAPAYYFTTTHLQTGFKSLIIAHLSLASFWQNSQTKCHIYLLMTIMTVPTLNSLY